MGLLYIVGVGKPLDPNVPAGHQFCSRDESMGAAFIPDPGVPENHRRWGRLPDLYTVSQIDFLVDLDEIRKEIEDVVELFLKALEIVGFVVQGGLPGS